MGQIIVLNIFSTIVYINAINENNHFKFCKKKKTESLIPFIGKNTNLSFVQPFKLTTFPTT